MPKVSQAAWPSQHATPVAIVPRVQVAPPSVENARKMLFVPDRFEVATRLFVFVGLTFTKLSAWLPAVALTLTTDSTHVSGVNRFKVLGARSGGLMHLRVPSGTSMPVLVAGICAYKVDVESVRKAKKVANRVSDRRVSIFRFF